LEHSFADFGYNGLNFGSLEISYHTLSDNSRGKKWEMPALIGLVGGLKPPQKNKCRRNGGLIPFLGNF